MRKRPHHLTKSLTAKGWLPNYHGGWVMIILPAILGIVYSNFYWMHLLLLTFWWVSYFAFFAISSWLSHSLNKKYLPAVKTYSILSCVAMAVLLFFAPYLVGWLILFLPLGALSAWGAYRRQERSLFNNTLTVIAACLLLPITYDLGLGGSSFDTMMSSNDWQHIGLLTLLVYAYFEGTVLYVKTNIRERKSNNYLIASVLFHILFTVFAFLFASDDGISYLHAFVWSTLAVRSLFVPVYGRIQKPLSPKQIGIGEFVFSLLIFCSLV